MPALKCFKSYDIRGELGPDFNEEVAYRIGRAYGDVIEPKTVVIGGDVRLSSESLKKSLSDGLRDAGVNVIDLGVTGTEEIYFATSYLKVDGGIQVTASHNPINYNGMKLVRSESRPISNNNGLLEIKRCAEENQFSSNTDLQKGSLKSVNLLNDYLEHLFTYIKKENFKNKLKIVVNSGNGASCKVVNGIESKIVELGLPIELVKVHNEPNGNFPNGIPNPLLPECRSDTIKSVLENKADMGVAFDGDFDRCFFFDHEGKFIEGYYIVGLLSEVFLNKKSGQKIIHDPRLIWHTIEKVKSLGGIPIISKTGHAFIKEKMRDVDAIYGGEMSAHHYFKSFNYCDSGMIPWLMIAELVSNKGISLKDVVDESISAFPSSGEINISLSNPIDAIEKLLDFYKQKSVVIDDIDGLSIEFDRWRFNFRVSNTEPVARLNVESRGDKILLEEKTKELISIISSC